MVVSEFLSKAQFIKWYGHQDYQMPVPYAEIHAEGADLKGLPLFQLNIETQNPENGFYPIAEKEAIRLTEKSASMNKLIESQRESLQ